jgi:hypothetical protein
MGSTRKAFVAIAIAIAVYVAAGIGATLAEHSITARLRLSQ